MISSPYATFTATRQPENTTVSMEPDPRLTPQQIAKISAEILKCQRLLRTLWSESSRREVLNYRSDLYRVMYNISKDLPVPMDFQPAPHPQTEKLTAK